MYCIVRFLFFTSYGQCSQQSWKNAKTMAADEVDFEILRQLNDLEKMSLMSLIRKTCMLRVWLEHLKKMTPERRAMAKLKIQQVLYEVQYCLPQAPYTGIVSQN